MTAVDYKAIFAIAYSAFAYQVQGVLTVHFGGRAIAANSTMLASSSITKCGIGNDSGFIFAYTLSKITSGNGSLVASQIGLVTANVLMSWIIGIRTPELSMDLLMGNGKSCQEGYNDG